MPRKPTLLKPSPISHCHRTKRFLFVSMAAATSFLTLISLLLFFSISSSTHTHHSHPHPPSPKPLLSPNPSPNPNPNPPPPQISQACKATRFPQTCESTLLTQLGNVSNPPKQLEIVQSAISASAQNLKTAQSMVKLILDSSSGNLNRSTAAKNCMEVLQNSEYRLSSTSADALPRGRTKDARAWLSAAVCFQYDCWSALKYVNDSQPVNQTMAFLNSLITLTSNALSLTRSYDLYRDEIASWMPPVTERDGFWESSGAGGGVGSGGNGGLPAGLTANVTVCKKGGDGSKCFPKVQAAVDAAPENLVGGEKFVIWIREGVYEETVRVPLEKRNLVFLGDGMGKTVITGSAKVGSPGVTTYSSATVGVVGDGFMARDLTIENKAGPDAHQAVAFRSDSDLSIIENCEFLGNQDTLYAHSLRQFYKSCRISGNVDFIFGNSAAVFQDCLVLVRPRQISPEKGENNAVTAHGRTDPAQSTGFVFRNCTINGTAEYMALYRSKSKVHRNYLGRPWKEFSRTVFLNCYMEELISPVGWMPWSGDFALATLYYGEFESGGPGGNALGRVTWSSQLPKEHVQAYSVENFIQGNEWIPVGSTN